MSAAAADPNRRAPTHVGLGARLGLDLPPPPGEPEVDAAVRIDAGRIRLVADAPEPPRKPQAVHAHVAAARPGGWLVGQAAGAGPRIRAATLDVGIAPAAGGGVAVTPSLALTDVVLGAARRDLRLGDDDLGPALSLLAEAFGDRLDADVLAGLASNPVATLEARLDATLDAVEAALGGALSRALTGIPLELTLDRATWTLGLRTTADLALGEGVTLAIDGGFSLATMRPTLQAALTVGAVTLIQRDGTLTLAADPWLAPLTVLPAPSPATLRDRLLPVLPRVALSAALSAGLGELLGTTGTLGALDSLLADPGARLRQLTAGDIQDILRAAAQAAGVDDANGLHLPGDFVLRASGADPLRLDLSGTVDLGGGAPTLTVDLWLDVGADRRVGPGGSVTVDAALAAGSWGRLATTFSVDAGGVGLVLTPQGAAPITLLPRFSGFADLAAAAATSLLPHVLQAIVGELRPAVGPPDGVLGAVLAIATDLGIYADDAQGFEAPGRIAALAAMLEPGWLDDRLGDPAGLATLATGLFGPPPLLQMPIGGAPVAAGDRISWTAPLPAPATGDVTVTVAVGSPAVSVVVTGLAVGPLVVETAGVGFDGDFVLEVAVALDPGGDLAFLRPAAELGVDGDRVRAALLPLGRANRADVEVVLAPAPALTFDPGGALALLLEWGVPLVGKLALRAAGSAIDEALWTVGASEGPTARDVLEGAGLLQPGAPGGDPLLALPLPSLDQIALGAVQTLASGIEVPVTDALRLAVVDDGSGRKGIRLVGHQELDAGDMTVSLSFGETIDPEWLEDPAAGVTLWLLDTHPAALPTLAPGIQAIGLGALLGKKDDAPLIDTALAIGKAGGMVFFALDLIDPTGAPHVAVSQLGGAIDLRDAQINIASSDGDGFIQKLLPPELQAPFQLAVSARAGRGLELFGGIGSTPGMIELTFPLDLDLGGIVQIDEVFVSAGRVGSLFELIAAISGGAHLGPVDVAVQRVGLRLDLGQGPPRFGFKAPDALGLSIDTPTLTLGGFLLIDEVHGRYVGAVEIAIAQKFSLVAIGIITTKNPDGSPGFSLLLLVAMELPVPIPMGYGFFFAGAGGLLGLNRGIDLDRLRIGLRAGTAESILFPTDIVARIDTIVRDLEEVFPKADGRFLVAPMIKITWSTPPLITGEVGVIVEIGSPLRLALLGLVKLELPTPDEAVVSIKVAFLGAVDIPASLLSFDASIYDSYLGYDDFKLSLEGDLALRVCWGPQPDFLMSVGGFHPSYTPAAYLHVPPLRRMTIALLKDNPSIRLESYFALTSNTVQFGAKLSLRGDFGVASIDGELGLDVLVQIVPVHLEAHIYGRVSVKVMGIDALSISLDLLVTGPTPWVIRGSGHFKVLLFSVTVGFEFTLGAAAPALLPLVAVLPRLIDALDDDAAWTAELAAEVNDLVTLIPPPAGSLVIDAAGLLTVSQRLMPLGTDISLFGTAEPDDISRVDLGPLRVGGAAAPVRDVTDAFAPAAFARLSDADKLRAAAFEQRTAGVQATSGDALVTDAVVSWPVRYETIELDSAVSTTPRRGTGSPDQGDFEALARGGLIGLSAASAARARIAQRGSVLDVEAGEERFAVAGIGDLRPLDASGAVVGAAARGALLSYSDAMARRDALVASGAAADLQILPEAQVG